MFDSINLSQIPAEAVAAAGYANGSWATWPALQQRLPHAHLLSITVSAAADADCLDVEKGDATPGQATGWLKRQAARKAYRPVIYANASTMPGLLSALAASGISRSSVRLWSAHYDGPHICGPATCRYPGVPACDGTQWTPNALGRNLDESLLLDDFFATPEPPVTIQSWKSDGQTSLAQLAAQHKTGCSTILRLTAEHGKYGAPLASWLDSVFGGTQPPGAPVPPGVLLWVPAS
jgi:hypothetical protein